MDSNMTVGFDFKQRVDNWGDNPQEREEYHQRLKRFMLEIYPNILQKAIDKKDSKNEELQKYINHYKINIPLLYLYMISRPKEDNYFQYEAPLVENWCSSGDMTMEHIEDLIESNGGWWVAKEVAEILQGAINRFHQEPINGDGSDYYDYVPDFDEL